MNDASPPARLKIHLLGHFHIDVSGRALPQSAVKGRKARSLLKLLALQRHFRLIRDQAIDVLWPELDAAAGAAQLYKALHHIRRAFAACGEEASEWIEITDDLIRLVPPGGAVTDVQLFEQRARTGLRDRKASDLETAVSLYAGDLLPMDFYEEWASLPREHYRQLYLDVLVALATLYEQRGELYEAAEMLRMALDKDPVLESAHRGLMRIFARHGQATRALRQFDLCKELLKKDLGIDPSPETMEALADVREQRLHREIDSRGVRPAVPAPAGPLIGRAAECAEIDRSLDRLSAGEGGSLFISGAAGMGKTRMAQELALRARERGIDVLWGGAGEGERSIAYGAFVQLFDAVLREHPHLEQHLPFEIGNLVPGFSGNGAPVPHADKLAARGYLFAQVHRFFARLAAERPVIVILEDLHAADQGSRALLNYLIRHGRELPILFAATLREDDAQPADGAVDGSVTMLRLSPLSREEHASLLRRQASTSEVPPETADRIFTLSEGNPLFALELLRSRRENGVPAGSEENGSAPAGPGSSRPEIPSSLRRIVEQQLDGLSPAGHHLLYLAAVIGKEVPYDLLSAKNGDSLLPDPGALFEALEEVTRAGLLEEHGLDYTFRHALVRQTVYESISEARRRALHGLVARRLVSMHADADAGPVEQIASHLIGAGEISQGVHYLVLAARRAEAAYAHDDALDRYRQALKLLEGLDDSPARRLRRELLERVGDVYRACGRLEQSYDAYVEAVGIAEKMPLGEPDLVELHRKIALIAIFRTEMDHSAEHLDRAFALVGEDRCARARLLITRALHNWHLNELDEAYRLAQEALSLAEAADAPAEASQACEILAMTCLPLGRWEEGLAFEMRRQVYGWSPEVVVATDAHLCLWEYHVGGEQPFQQARSFMQRVAEQAAQLGDLRCVAVCHYALGTMHLWRGESREAVEELEASLELHERVGSPAGMAYALARRGVLHTMQGAADLGWKAVQEGLVHAEKAAVRDHCLQRLYGVGIWNRLEAGDIDGARRLVIKSNELLEEAGACGACALELYPWMAYFYLRAGETQRARECGEAVLQLASKTGNPVGKALAAMIESSLLITERNEDLAQERRREAFALIQSAVTEAGHSPVVRYLDRMVDQQAALATGPSV